MRQPRPKDMQLKLNLPADLHEDLKVGAEANHRSLNAEVIHRLTSSEASETIGMADTRKTATLTVRLTDEMKARLDNLSQRGPYKISITSIIERGIELAAEELARLK